MARENRYSRLVTWVKVTLPLLALALLSTLFLFSQSPDPDRAIPYADVDVEQLAREQRLSQPRFAGVLDGGREVIMVADSASPEGGNTDVIEVRMVEGRMELDETDFMLLFAENGRIDIAGDLADLRGDVRLSSSMGYRLRSDVLFVGLREMDVEAPGDVRVTGPGLNLTAGSMHMTGRAEEELVHFTGGVRLLYEPGE